MKTVIDTDNGSNPECRRSSVLASLNSTPTVNLLTTRQKKMAEWGWYRAGKLFRAEIGQPLHKL